MPVFYWYINFASYCIMLDAMSIRRQPEREGEGGREGEREMVNLQNPLSLCSVLLLCIIVLLFIVVKISTFHTKWHLCWSQVGMEIPSWIFPCQRAASCYPEGALGSSLRGFTLSRLCDALCNHGWPFHKLIHVPLARS